MPTCLEKPEIKWISFCIYLTSIEFVIFIFLHSININFKIEPLFSYYSKVQYSGLD